MSHYQSRVTGTRSSNGTVAKSSRPGTPSSSSASTEVKPVIPKPESAWNAVHPQLSFQFGSIGPSIGTYVQIPARTSSAPPNLDEQKQDLLRFEALKPQPAKVPIPVSPDVNEQKQELSRFETVNPQPAKVPIPSGAQQQVSRSQAQKSGGLQQPPSFRPQPQQSAAMSAGIPQSPYHPQGQQHPMPVQVTQPNPHLQGSSVVTTQAHLPLQAHLIPPQPQQQGLVQPPYSQHTLQPQLQHNGTGQVLQYPQSMAGPPLMGPPLAPLPGPMSATPMTQMSHQLPAGLASGMPVVSYGVVPVSSSFIPPRTSSAVKIVHPETREELKFDYKSTKPDTFYDGTQQSGGAQQQVPRSHVQESAGWQQQQPSFRPQPQGSAAMSAGIPQLPYQQQVQQDPVPTQVTPRRKKKMKNILAKADAAGTTADLYNAYKAPEEKDLDELVPSKIGTNKYSTDDPVKQEVTPNGTAVSKDELVPSKVSTTKVSSEGLVKQEVTPNETTVLKELDDWEDAAQLPTPKVSPEVGDGGKTLEKHVPETKGGETHTQDLLLTYEEQTVDLPLDSLAIADVEGTTSDLCNADKASEERELDELDSAEASTDNLVEQEVVPNEIAASKELDDWEDAVELPTPKVSTTEVGDGVKTEDEHVSEMKGGETYTRDFLLTLKEQNVDLPLDFEVRPDIADLLLNPQAAFARFADRDMHSGRMLDWQLSGGPKRSSSSTFDDERWAKQGLHSSLWPDNHVDMGPPGGFRPGNAQGLIPRMPPNIRPTVPQLVPGLISGRPLTPGTSPGLFRTNSVESDRWQKMPTAQKGLIPSPHTPLPAVHKAEKRYEIGKASDEEELKQRQIKGILNKLTPQNFQKLFEQVKGVNIQSAITLTGVISQIFDKALTEPTFCEMYATFCKQLAMDMPEFTEDGEKVTFKRVLLNNCQEEFHRGEREQAEASIMEEDGNNKMSAEDREEKRVKAKRRMLGNIRFIGELYKKHMLTERIMHECIRKLLGDYENPEEEDVEALCKLMSTIGHMIDQPMTREHMDAYLERITRLSNNQKLSSRMRFMLKDVIDLRKNGWQERRKVEGPKKIEEVHRDAVQERQTTVAQAGRLSRGPSIGGASGRRLVPPPELNTQGRPRSPMFAPTTPMGSGTSLRGGRGPLVQDVRMEDRLLIDSRPMAMPLTQRLADEGPLISGPQGNLEF